MTHTFPGTKKPKKRLSLAKKEGKICLEKPQLTRSLTHTLTRKIVTIRTAGRTRPAQFKNRFKNSFDPIFTVFDTHRTRRFERLINLPVFAQTVRYLSPGFITFKNGAL